MSSSTADLMDADGGTLYCCDLQFDQFGGRRVFEGRVRTISCREDFGLIRRLLHEPGPGEVLVVDGGGSLHSALFGDRLATAAIESGWNGVVIAGAVRDAAALSRLRLGIKALGTSPRPSPAGGVGEVDVPVVLGHATFVPGAYLWSDEDGLVVTRQLVRAQDVAADDVG